MSEQTTLLAPVTLQRVPRATVRLQLHRDFTFDHARALVDDFAALGISLLPRSVVLRREAEGAVRAHTVPETIRHMQTTFITRKDSFISSALRAFIETFTSSLARAERS